MIEVLAPLQNMLTPVVRRQPRIGLVAGGLGTYWPQFPDLLPKLQESSRYVSRRFAQMDAEVVDVGFISDSVSHPGHGRRAYP